jgi:hypothetical protein
VLLITRFETINTGLFSAIPNSDKRAFLTVTITEEVRTSAAFLDTFFTKLFFAGCTNLGAFVTDVHFAFMTIYDTIPALFFGNITKITGYRVISLWFKDISTVTFHSVISIVFHSNFPAFVV